MSQARGAVIVASTAFPRLRSRRSQETDAATFALLRGHHLLHVSGSVGAAPRRDLPRRRPHPEGTADRRVVRYRTLSEFTGRVARSGDGGIRWVRFRSGRENTGWREIGASSPPSWRPRRSTDPSRSAAGPFARRASGVGTPWGSSRLWHRMRGQAESGIDEPRPPVCRASTTRRSACAEHRRL